MNIRLHQTDSIYLSGDIVSRGNPKLPGFKNLLGLYLMEPMQVILPDKSIRTFPPDPIPIELILERLEIPRHSVIIVKNGRVIPDDLIAEGEDQVRIIRVFHGG